MVDVCLDICCELEEGRCRRVSGSEAALIAQRKIFHLANRSQLIHPGPSSSRSSFFYGVESVVRGNADSLLN